MVKLTKNKKIIAGVGALLIIISVVYLVNAVRPKTIKTSPSSPSKILRTSPLPSDVKRTNIINIAGNKVEPLKIRVSINATVIWINNGNENVQIVPSYAEGDFHKSNDLKPNQTFEVTFKVPGTYSYHLAGHETMIGTVEVTI